MRSMQIINGTTGLTIGFVNSMQNNIPRANETISIEQKKYRVGEVNYTYFPNIITMDKIPMANDENTDITIYVFAI